MDDIEIKRTLSDNISLLRKSRNLNQQQLGDKLGYTFKAISKWELGETIPDIFTLEKIAKLFNVTIDELIHSKNITKASHKKRNHLLVTLVSSLLPFLLAAIIYLILVLFEINKAYVTWIAAISIGAIVAVVFTSLWYKKKYVFIAETFIIWPIAIIAMIVLSFKNWWLIFLIALILNILLGLFMLISFKRSQKVDIK